jgi:hypothetical protein
MGFNAADAVPKLEWDFTKYVAKAKGVSPEPSSEALYEFNTATRNLIQATIRSKKALALKEAEKLNDRSKEEKAAEVDRWAEMDLEEGMQAIFNELAEVISSEEVQIVARKQAALVAAVFRDCPTAEQILQLPGRVQAAYFGWVAGQLMSPEYGAAVTS